MPKHGATGTKWDQLEIAYSQHLRGFSRKLLVGVSAHIALITRPFERCPVTRLSRNLAHNSHRINKRVSPSCWHQRRVKDAVRAYQDLARFFRACRHHCKAHRAEDAGQTEDIQRNNNGLPFKAIRSK
jgi:hypothetical protein